MLKNRRYYKEIDGRKIRVPGVTTVLHNLGWGSELLIRWSNRMGLNGVSLPDAREQATAVGTRVHELICACFQGVDPPFCDWMTDEQHREVAASMAAWESWKLDTHPVPVVTEEALVGVRWHCAGRPDLIATIDGRLSVVDFKTSNSLYPKDIVQIGAYAALWDDNNPTKPIGAGYVVRLDKKSATFHALRIDLDVLSESKDVFDICMRLRMHEASLNKTIKSQEDQRGLQPDCEDGA